MFGERRIASRVYIQVLGSFGLINLNENLKDLSILKSLLSALPENVFGK